MVGKKRAASRSTKGVGKDFIPPIATFSISDLGRIRRVDITPGRLTIFSGPNGSGKTSALYTIYGALVMRPASFSTPAIKSLAEKLDAEGEVAVDLNELSVAQFRNFLTAASQYFTSRIPDILNCEESQVKDAKVAISPGPDVARNVAAWMSEWDYSNTTLFAGDLAFSAKAGSSEGVVTFKREGARAPYGSAEYISSVLLDVIAFPLVRKAFLLPSERAGINLFYQELNFRRTALINNLQKSKIDPFQLMRDVMVSRYAKPVADYIDLLNEFSDYKRDEGEFSDLADELDAIALGAFEVSKDGGIFFRPKGAKRKRLKLHLAASSAKSLFGLSFMLRYVLHVSDMVMIDEPELNLHPDAQREFARLLMRMVESGLRVMISTHSDYIVREINARMMERGRSKGIDPNMVELYIFDGKGGAARVDKEENGCFSSDPFEDSIRALNDSYINALFG